MDSCNLSKNNKIRKNVDEFLAYHCVFQTIGQDTFSFWWLAWS